MMNKKILTTTIAIVAALGLAGCSTSATSTSQISGHEPQAAKIAKATKTSTHKAAKKDAASEQKVNDNNDQGTKVAAKAATTTSNQASGQAAKSAKTNEGTTAQATTASANQAKSEKVATKATNKTDAQVLNGFMAQSGIKAEVGNQYIVTNQGNGQYQIEVRNSNGDANVSHLSGLYHYNTNTNQVSQMNVTTGQFN